MIDIEVSEEEEEVKVAKTTKKKDYTINDIMGLDKSLQISKKKKGEVVAPIVQKSKNIKKKKHAARS